ncbi:hypothetical protein FGB62_602g00 [Gracilaria domingensis]|nr:hypothetical protein FGB62_602g00 [Gracilaria domingensis]
MGQATYWLPNRQASDFFEKLAQYWEAHRQRFSGSLDDVAAVSNVIDARNFGKMLARYAMGSAEIVHGYGVQEEHRERTLIHGDAKAANMFFRRKGVSRENYVNLEEVMASETHASLWAGVSWCDRDSEAERESVHSANDDGSDNKRQSRCETE